MSISPIRLARVKRDIAEMEDVLKRNKVPMLGIGRFAERASAASYEDYHAKLSALIHSHRLMPGYQYAYVTVWLGARNAYVPEGLQPGDAWIIQAYGVEMEGWDPAHLSSEISISLYRKTPAGQTDGVVKQQKVPYVYDEAFHDANMGPRSKQRWFGVTEDKEEKNLAQLTGLLKAESSRGGIVGTVLTYSYGLFDRDFHIEDWRVRIPLAMPRQPKRAKRSRKTTA